MNRIEIQHKNKTIILIGRSEFPLTELIDYLEKEFHVKIRVEEQNKVKYGRDYK